MHTFLVLNEHIRHRARFIRSLALAGASGIATFTNMYTNHHYAVVAAQTDDAVQVIDVTDPTGVIPTDSIRQTDQPSTLALDGATGVAIINIDTRYYALVASKTGVQIIDVTDPSNIVATGSMHVNENGNALLGGLKGIDAFGAGTSYYAAVTSPANNATTIINITNPATPVIAGSITDTGNSLLAGASGIDAFAIGRGHYLAVTSPVDHGISFIHVGDYDTPQKHHRHIQLEQAPRETFCDEMTIEELVLSERYNVIDSRNASSGVIINGTNDADLILGSAYDDHIKGKKGKDCIVSGAGDDVVFAGRGHDTIYGQAGDDELHGGPGRDTIHCGDDNDHAYPGRGSDTIKEDCEKAGRDKSAQDDGNDDVLAPMVQPAQDLTEQDNTVQELEQEQPITLPQNHPPTVSAPLNDVILINNNSTHRASLSGVFADADSDALAITASSSNDTIATASVSSDNSTLVITAHSRGTATITVVADDGNGGIAQDPIRTTVKSAPVLALAGIDDISSIETGTIRGIDVSGLFMDADSDALTITASSSNDTIATASVSPSLRLAVVGVSEGNVTITISAQDIDGNTVSESFEASVVDPPPPPPQPAQQVDIVDQYDTNSNGRIDFTEYIAAVNDWRAGKITTAERDKIAEAYLSPS